MKFIALTGKNGVGKYSIVDDEDFEYLNQWRWQLGKDGYANRHSSNRKGVATHSLMHRVIAKTPRGLFTDHINRNKLDNQKKNLRIVTRSQNQRNRGKNRNNTSGFKNVWLHKPTGRYITHIYYNGKNHSLGTFGSAIEAKRRYEEEYIKIFKGGILL